jgi:hypothetical protein
LDASTLACPQLALESRTNFDLRFVWGLNANIRDLSAMRLQLKTGKAFTIRSRCPAIKYSATWRIAYGSETIPTQNKLLFPPVSMSY